MSWFWRGAQSAVFYYLSCTPWFSYLHERRRGRERNQARAAKASEDVEAGTYAHPLPADTNPYWNEEIIQGPEWKRGRVSKEKAKSESTKRLNTGGPNSSSGEDSTLTFPSLEGVEEPDDSWNKKIYQRPDEYLLGSDDPTCAPYATLSSRAANKPLVSGDGAYYNARTPAVSELHPPVISNRPKHSSQAQWMIQPPPSAKIMEGKERADRSRSVSNASYGSMRGTGGAMAGREASLRRLTSRQPENIPIDLDPSPPEDDGKNLEEDGSHISRAISNQSTSDPSKKNKPPRLQVSSQSLHKDTRLHIPNGTSNQHTRSTTDLPNGSNPSGVKNLAPTTDLPNRDQSSEVKNLAATILPAPVPKAIPTPSVKALHDPVPISEAQPQATVVAAT